MIFECPAKCDFESSLSESNNQDEKKEKKKYNFDQLEDHLLYECPNMLVSCPRCHYKELRSKFTKRHDFKKCIQILQDKQSGFDKELRDFKKKRSNLLDQYENLRESNNLENGNNNQSYRNYSNRARHNPFGESFFEEPLGWDIEPQIYNFRDFQDYADDFESSNPFSFRRDNNGNRGQSRYIWPLLNGSRNNNNRMNNNRS